MSKLKIYMCSGVGDARGEYQYWLDGTSTASNTKAVNSLLARINELCTELDYLPLSKEEQLAHYNEIDLLVVALQFARRCQGDDTALARAGHILQHAIHEKKFDFDDTTDSARADHLDAVFHFVDSAFSAGKDYESDGIFAKWWEQVIVPANRQGLTPEEIAASKRFFEKQSIGDTADDYKERYGDIGVYLYKSADYFLYLYIPEEKVAKLPYFLRTKVRKQREVYNYVRSVFLALYSESEDDLQRVIRTRIIAEMHQTPEEAVGKLLRSRGIGDFGIAEIIALITAIASIVVPLITALLQYAQTVLQAKYAVPENIDDGCPEGEDWKETTTASPMLKYGLLALLVVLVLKNRKS